MPTLEELQQPKPERWLRLLGLDEEGMPLRQDALSGIEVTYLSELP